MPHEKVIAIVGPTAVGKTSLSLDIAEQYRGEVVSADSRQVYQGLTIGSGKILPNEMRGIPHHLIDVVDPRDTYTAAQFVAEGREAIRDIHARGNVPIVVGGTGFYVDALLGRITLPPVPPNEALRNELRALKTEEVAQRLQAIDRDAYARMDTKNPRRLIRAIEIAEALGRVPPLVPHTPLYPTLWIGVTLPKDELARAIKKRLEQRLESGMLEEARQLHEEGLSFERMEELGLEYRFMARYLKGELPYDDMVRDLEKEIVEYAKRQMTWFKKNQDIAWFEPREREKIMTTIQTFLS